MIRNYAKEYIKEFKKAHLGEQDEDFYIYVGDKNYFEFRLINHKLIFIGISEIVYW